MEAPLIIAHRGASAQAPENTLAAFILAHEQKADMIELDVRRSADGELVVFHDETTARWEGQPRLVQSCTVNDLRALDIGGERIAILAEVCEFARKTNIALNVELKQPDIVAQSVALLRSYGIAGRTLISSFYEPALRQLQRIAPDICRGYLMGIRTLKPKVRARELWPFLALRRAQASAWHPSLELPLLPWIIPIVRRAGYSVNVWTVDDPALMQRLVQCGTTGIITNRPDVAWQSVGSVH
ncbi:MAG: glycerophosphodiester phosphodiesterase [Chloroflexales bacterium]|nr:glycerophosphodiester phosphodiesterase [Chloroflexales bacterium]